MTRYGPTNTKSVAIAAIPETAWVQIPYPDSGIAQVAGDQLHLLAEGEERMALSLPRGYGYPNKATDRWALLYMLMNHKPQTLKGYIRYRVRYVTGEALTPVKPVWLDVRNCGGGKSFSTFTETAHFTMPESGRLVAGGGHLHGGGIRVELRNATCRTKLFESLGDR